MIKNIKMILQYDGSHYHGFQRIPGDPDTIQGRIEFILKNMTKEEVLITGAGRTDKGVHALGQVINFKLNSEHTTGQIYKFFSENLPRDMEIIGLEETDIQFHARYQAKSKTYLYQIWNNTKKNIFNRMYYYHVKEKLIIKLMQEAAKLFLGTHNFKNFCVHPSKKKSCVRTINSLVISQNKSGIFIEINADGFLHKMVRIICGSIIAVGKGDYRQEQIAVLRDQEKIGIEDKIVAPAHALFLKEIFY
jgi:tRNA pseudouridine38-40 synthase